MALPIPQQQPWQRMPIEKRSVEIARRRDADRGCYADGVRFGHGTRDGHEIWYAASRHDVTVRYLVSYNPATDAVYECSCPSYGACSHRGSVRLAIERRKARVAAEAIETPAPAPVIVPVLTPKPVCPTCGGRGWVSYRRNGYRHELACLDCNRERALRVTA